MFPITRIFEEGSIVIYRRDWKEPGMKKYFATTDNQKSLGAEFRTITEAKAYLKKFKN